MSDNKELKQAQTVFNSLCKALDSDGWHYEKDEERMMIKCGAQGEDLPIAIRIHVDADRALVILCSQLPFVIAEGRRREMAVAIAQANNGMIDGCFDYDYFDGNIIFRITTSIRESLISEKALQYLIYCACSTVDNYNDKFLMVAKSEMTCDEIAKFIV